MSNSPFKNKDAEKIIMSFVQDEIFPTINKIKDLNEKIFMEKKTSFADSFLNYNLKNLVLEYEDLNSKFFICYKKFTTPDILFVSLTKDKNTTADIMLDYFNFQGVVNKHLDEGFKLLEIGDRNLDRKLNFINQNISRAIAIVAIVVSIFSVFLIK